MQLLDVLEQHLLALVGHAVQVGVGLVVAQQLLDLLHVVGLLLQSHMRFVCDELGLHQEVLFETA